jgi:threonine dehydrogenase-like Zn-dependent dehydrogenase
VRLLADGKLPAEGLITDTAPLERAQEMFERLESPATDDVKILLSPTA